MRNKISEINEIIRDCIPMIIVVSWFFMIIFVLKLLLIPIHR